MKEMILKGEKYHISIADKGDGVILTEGCFGALLLKETPLITLELRSLETGEQILLSGDKGWQSTSCRKLGEGYRITLQKPCSEIDLVVILTLAPTPDGVHFDTHISNRDERYSVIEVTYPIPQIKNDVFDLFITSGPGRVVRDFRRSGVCWNRLYPSVGYCMQYMAMLAEGDVLYVGHHDREARSKQYYVDATVDPCRVAVGYPAENLGCGANSFSLRGGVTWEYIKGDWYDATMRYAEFVKTADWLPDVGDYGRPETEDYFKELPFWIMDFMPNIKEQGDNMPENLRYKVTVDKDSWWRDALRLKETLGVPLGYHVYNWHKNAFNIDYPHFLPAKDDFKAGLRRLQEAGIYVAPYINASSWDSRDNAPSSAAGFRELGVKCAAKDKDGKIVGKVYPQVKPNGERTNLIAVCPATPAWQRIISELSARIFDELDVDGIYYDQSAALMAIPCTDRTHPHTPGNSGAWVDGVRHMMQRVRAEMPEGKFLFTECNSEPYINAFDGFLTWHWGEDGEVPAFPAIYSKYITMVGRVIKGNKKQDKFLSRYTLAASFVMGQQLGWCNLDIQDDPEVFPFLQRLVQLRYRQRALFVTGTMLRPPLVKSNLADHKTFGHIWTKNDIFMPAVVAGGWQSAEEGKRHIFLFNVDDSVANCTVTLRASEHGIDGKIPTVLAPYQPVLDRTADTLQLYLDLEGQGALHLTY